MAMQAGLRRLDLAGRTRKSYAGGARQTGFD
jgi:hypothetical protein